ncbi:MAG: hypothetical protein Q3997_08505, partial [Propionibacteriaceae bacterium]|nr:hypothetical protein [Propionibacteriaceae bacterium]
MASATDTTSHSADDFGANAWLIDEMYEAYQADPASVDPSWRAYFEQRQAPTPPPGPAPQSAPRPQASPQTGAPRPSAPAA